MASFGIELESEEMKDYLRDCNFRLQEKHLLNNPFNGKIAKVKKKGAYIIQMIPVYPKVYILGYVILISILILFGVNWFMVFPFGLILMGFFWNKWFFFLTLRHGLRKKGYKGKIRLLGNEETITRCLETLNSV